MNAIMLLDDKARSLMSTPIYTSTTSVSLDHADTIVMIISMRVVNSLRCVQH